MSVVNPPPPKPKKVKLEDGSGLLEETKNFIPHDITGKKLIIRAWSQEGYKTPAKVLAYKKIRYGAPHAILKVAKVQRMYKINYEHMGGFKQIGRRLYYDTMFDNATGALSYSEFPEDVDSTQAFDMFKDSAVKAYVAKGGLKMIYFIIAITGAMLAIGGLLYFASQALQLSNQHTVDFKDLTNAESRIRADESALSTHHLPIPPPEIVIK